MAEQEVIVEEAQLSDVKTLVDLLSQVSQETDFVVAETILSQEDMEIFLARHLESVNEICLVVRVGKKLAGVLNVSSTSSPQTNHIGDIFIAVQEKYWGYGHGKEIINLCIQKAKDLGLKKINLKVAVSNERAIRLYRKYGFSETGIEDKCVVMRLDTL